MEIKIKHSTLQEEFLSFPAPDFAIFDQNFNLNDDARSKNDDKNNNINNNKNNNNNNKNNNKNFKLIVPGAVFNFFQKENDER